MRPSLLVYLHGFNSSPESHKAQVMKQYCQQYRPDIELYIPELPHFPKQTEALLLEKMKSFSKSHRIGLVGSSLGGYLSIWLNAKFGAKAVLINPAVKPYELLTDYLGVQENMYSKKQYVLEAHHVDELKELDVDQIQTPNDFWLLQQKGDEVLDYRQAVDKLVGAKQTVEEGGDHSFIDFERYPEQIVKFLEL